MEGVWDRVWQRHNNLLTLIALFLLLGMGSQNQITIIRTTILAF